MPYLRADGPHTDPAHNVVAYAGRSILGHDEPFSMGIRNTIAGLAVEETPTSRAIATDKEMLCNATGGQDLGIGSRFVDASNDDASLEVIVDYHAAGNSFDLH